MYDVCLVCSARVSPLALRKLTKHARSQNFDMYVVAWQQHRVKLKLNVACGAISALQLCRPIVPLPPRSSLHSSPEAPRTT